VLSGLLASILYAEPAKSERIAATHPILGLWHVDVPALKCFEEEKFLPDGTRFVISGQGKGQGRIYDLGHSRCGRFL